MVWRLRKQSFSSLCVLHDDGADGAVLCRIQNFLDRIPLGVDRLRLPLLIEHEDLRGNRLAHGIPDAYIMINRDSDFSCHDAPLIPAHWKRLERTEGNTRLICQRPKATFILSAPDCSNRYQDGQTSLIRRQGSLHAPCLSLHHTRRAQHDKFLGRESQFSAVNRCIVLP